MYRSLEGEGVEAGGKERAKENAVSLGRVCEDQRPSKSSEKFVVREVDRLVVNPKES